ncbi:hypothetical protein ACVWXN_009716 [Bradyrhizobium sp. i1.4.4]
MNQNGQPHSSAWVTFTYASFAASAFLVAIGIFFLPIDLWMKGYLTMGHRDADPDLHHPDQDGARQSREQPAGEPHRGCQGRAPADGSVQGGLRRERI